jgi:hypothetical protein
MSDDSGRQISASGVIATNQAVTQMPTSHDATPSAGQGGNCVRSLPERAKQGGFSIATLRRLIKAGEGPVVTRLSARRLGIRDDHWSQWLDARSAA